MNLQVQKPRDTVSVDMGCLSLECTPLCLKPVNELPNKGKNRKKKNSDRSIDLPLHNLKRPSRDLTGAHAMVANFATMLNEDHDQFIETLFRAVKLNKVDVVKILVTIAQKNGRSLSGSEIREPESSATILHVALLSNKIEVLDYLLSLDDPALVMARYDTHEYRNQTALHVAVANGDDKVIDKLLSVLDVPERQVLINTVADGHYFKHQHPHGQLCLTAALWASKPQVVKLLVHYGANLNLQNDQGHTVLHSLIIQSCLLPDSNDYNKQFQCLWEAALTKAKTMAYESLSDEHRTFQEKQMQVNYSVEL